MLKVDLNKQTVFITGVGRGVGAELAKAFSKEGANVIINGLINRFC